MAPADDFKRFYADELRPALQSLNARRMLALKHKVDGEVHFAFTGSEVHVAIASEEDRFEFELLRTLLKPADIAAYLEDLRLIIGIVEDLNLNTRIWSKE